MVPASVVITLIENAPHHLLLQALLFDKPHLLESHLPKEALLSLAWPRLLRVRFLSSDIVLQAELCIVKAEPRCYFFRGDEADVPLGWADPRYFLIEIDWTHWDYSLKDLSGEGSTARYCILHMLRTWDRLAAGIGSQLRPILSKGEEAEIIIISLILDWICSYSISNDSKIIIPPNP